MVTFHSVEALVNMDWQNNLKHWRRKYEVMQLILPIQKHKKVNPKCQIKTRLEAMSSLECPSILHMLQGHYQLFVLKKNNIVISVYMYMLHMTYVDLYLYIQNNVAFYNSINEKNLYFHLKTQTSNLY